MRKKSYNYENNSQPNKNRGGETKVMKTGISKILIFALLLTMMVPSFAFAAEDTGLPYSDIDSVATKGDILLLSSQGIINGYPDGTFKPEGQITRAEFSKILIETLGWGAQADALKGDDTKFSDVKGSHWASGYVAIASSKGLVVGFEDGTFRPSKNVTHAEAVTMLVRALGLESTEQSTPWYLNNVLIGSDFGLLADGFDAKANANRGQIAQSVVAFQQVPVNTVSKKVEKNATNDFLRLELFETSVVLTTGAYTAPTATTEGSVTLVTTDGTALPVAIAKDADVFGTVKPGSTVQFTFDANGDINYLFVAETAENVVEGVVKSVDSSLTKAVVIVDGSEKVFEIATGTFTFTANQKVALVLDVNGKVVDYAAADNTVSGKVTSVSEVTANGVTTYSLGLDGTVYTNTAAPAVAKKDTKGTALVAPEFSSLVVGDSVTIGLTYDGKLTSVNAQALSVAGAVEAKTAAVVDDVTTPYVNEATVADITVGGHKYSFTADTLVKRNGALTSYDNVKVGDSVVLGFEIAEDGSLELVSVETNVVKVTDYVSATTAYTAPSTLARITVTDSVYYDIKANAKVVVDGVEQTGADITADELNNLQVTAVLDAQDNQIVELTANTVKVEGYPTAVDATAKTVTVNGVKYTVGDLTTTFDTNLYYVLKLGKDNVVYGVTAGLKESVGVVNSLVKSTVNGTTTYTAVISGTTYTVTSAQYAELGSVNAKAFMKLNKDGSINSVVADYTAVTGTIAAISSTTDNITGTVTNTITVGSTVYTVNADAKITVNGSTVAFKDLKAGDSVTLVQDADLTEAGPVANTKARIITATR